MMGACRERTHRFHEARQCGALAAALSYCVSDRVSNASRAEGHQKDRAHETNV